jgi:aldose 1-epimerase
MAEIITQDFGLGYTLYTLINSRGVEVDLTDFGARLVNFKVPVAGEVTKRNIVLGYDTAEEYLGERNYYGATIGRVAGRIADASFDIDGVTYHVDVNDPEGYSLHGGSFHEKKFEASLATANQSVTFTYKSSDGEEGFPGELVAKVTYKLTEDNDLVISYEAKTDAPTLYNPTNHTYFNLSGDPTHSVADDMLRMDTPYYAPLNVDGTVAGTKEDVAGTPFDFRIGKRISKAIFDTENDQINLVGGLDHPFFLNQQTLGPQVVLTSEDKQLQLEMTTSEPSVVVFTTNVEERPVMHGRPLVKHGGITLETQVAPSAERHPGFGNIVLNHGETYSSTTVFHINNNKEI